MSAPENYMCIFELIKQLRFRVDLVMNIKESKERHNDMCQLVGIIFIILTRAVQHDEVKLPLRD